MLSLQRGAQGPGEPLAPQSRPRFQMSRSPSDRKVLGTDGDPGTPPAFRGLTPGLCPFNTSLGGHVGTSQQNSPDPSNQFRGWVGAALTFPLQAPGAWERWSSFLRSLKRQLCQQHVIGSGERWFTYCHTRRGNTPRERRGLKGICLVPGQRACPKDTQVAWRRHSLGQDDLRVTVRDCGPGGLVGRAASSPVATPVSLKCILASLTRDNSSQAAVGHGQLFGWLEGDSRCDPLPAAFVEWHAGPCPLREPRKGPRQVPGPSASRALARVYG